MAGLPGWAQGVAELGAAIRVLVVDDSAFMRHTVHEVLQADPAIQVIATSTDGEDAWGKLVRFRPDVITLDVEMPKMDGLSLLRRVMRERPTRVVMLSSLTRDGAETTLEALSVGAVDFVPKPSVGDPAERDQWAGILRTKVRCAAEAKLLTPAAPFRPGGVVRGEGRQAEAPHGAGEGRSGTDVAGRVRPAPGALARSVVVMGASTGGPNALEMVLCGLPRPLRGGILIVQHMPIGFTTSLARRLDRVSRLTVREARNGDRLRDGLALLAPAGLHMEVGRGGVIRLTDAPPVQFVRPSVDVTMRSAASVYKGRCVGVILTGMGRDGLDGCRSIKMAGGCVMTQHGATAVIDSMPRVVQDAGLSDVEKPLHEAAASIVEWLDRRGR